MLNIAVLMGRLVADPELKHTPNDIPVISFTIAINRKFAKAGEEKQTDFIDIVAWRNTAEFISKYFRKGQMIAIEGSIQTRSYQDKEGNKRKAFEVVANNVHFTESKKAAADSTVTSSEEKNSSKNWDLSAFSNGNDNDFLTNMDSDEDLPF